MTGVLRRIFGRDVKASGTQTDGKILIADSASSGGFTWSDLLIRAGLGRNLGDSPNLISSGSLDDIIQPGEYSYTSAVTDTPWNEGLLKVWRKSALLIYQQVTGSLNRGIATRSSTDGGATWESWKIYAVLEDLQGNIQSLTGSGTFTVPAGITKLKVTLAGGSTASLYWTQGSHGGFNFQLQCVPQQAACKSAVIAVTPGQTFAYSVGAGQTLTRDGTSLPPDFVHLVEGFAGISTFGTLSAKNAISMLRSTGAQVYGSSDYLETQGAIGGAHSPTDIIPIALLGEVDGRLPRPLTSNVTSAGWTTAEYYNTDSSWTYVAGDAGYIIVEY